MVTRRGAEGGRSLAVGLGVGFGVGLTVGTGVGVMMAAGWFAET